MSSLLFFFPLFTKIKHKTTTTTANKFRRKRRKMTTTTKKSMSNACIPEDVLIEILARLPMKSLLRFRVDLFALSTGSWRSVCIGDLCYELYGFDSLPAFVNGAAHWVVFNLRKDCVCILAFDIVDEVFREIALPNHQIDVILRTDGSITVLGKSLAVILYEAVFTFVKTIGTNHVWVMEEYGVIESWTKGCRMIGKQKWLTVLGSRKNGNVLMVQDGLPGPRELVSCDTKSRQIKHLGLHGESFYVNTYMESLVALDVADGV